jgi:hypothetical protein
VGPILISVNPYKWNKPIYAEDVMKSYHGSGKKTGDGQVCAYFLDNRCGVCRR